MKKVYDWAQSNGYTLNPGVLILAITGVDGMFDSWLYFGQI